MCVNPLEATFASSTLGYFNFPIGDGTITGAMEAAGTYHLYVTFEISVIDALGAVVITEIFTEAPITANSITKACESIDQSMELTSLTEVDVLIGLVGTEADWNTSISVLSDAMHSAGYNGIIDTGVRHNSLASSLVTLVVQAKPILYATNLQNELTFTMDYLTSMHFLDENKFLHVQGLLQRNEAYTIDMINSNMELQWTSEATESCSTSNNNLYSCAVRRSIVAGVDQNNGGAHDFALPDYSNDDAGCEQFITNNLLVNISLVLLTCYLIISFTCYLIISCIGPQRVCSRIGVQHDRPGAEQV
jgi:hypothetical protein